MRLRAACAPVGGRCRELGRGRLVGGPAGAAGRQDHRAALEDPSRRRWSGIASRPCNATWTASPPSAGGPLRELLQGASAGRGGVRAASSRRAGPGGAADEPVAGQVTELLVQPPVVQEPPADAVHRPVTRGCRPRPAGPPRRDAGRRWRRRGTPRTAPRGRGRTPPSPRARCPPAGGGRRRGRPCRRRRGSRGLGDRHDRPPFRGRRRVVARSSSRRRAAAAQGPRDVVRVRGVAAAPRSPRLDAPAEEVARTAAAAPDWELAGHRGPRLRRLPRAGGHPAARRRR